MFNPSKNYLYKDLASWESIKRQHPSAIVRSKKVGKGITRLAIWGSGKQKHVVPISYLERKKVHKNPGYDYWQQQINLLSERFASTTSPRALIDIKWKMADAIREDGEVGEEEKLVLSQKLASLKPGMGGGRRPPRLNPNFNHYKIEIGRIVREQRKLYEEWKQKNRHLQNPMGLHLAHKVSLVGILAIVALKLFSRK